MLLYYQLFVMNYSLSITYYLLFTVMLDLKKIRENPDEILKLLHQRSTDYQLQPILNLDSQQRKILSIRTELQARSNEIGKIIGEKMRGGVNPQSEEISGLKEEGNNVKGKLAELEPEERELKAKIEALLLELPNLPSATTPIGKNETENIEVRRWGDEFIPDGGQILPHGEIGEKLGLIDSERAVKVAQSRFVALVGMGAALERALISFMLD